MEYVFQCMYLLIMCGVFLGQVPLAPVAFVSILEHGNGCSVVVVLPGYTVFAQVWHPTTAAQENLFLCVIVVILIAHD